MSEEEFKKIVAEYIGYNHSTGIYSEDRAQDLADEFECAKTTVIRWASGVANPRPRIKQLVMRYIAEKKVS